MAGRATGAAQARMSESETRSVPTSEGYDLWAPSYDGEDNPMLVLDELETPELLGDLADRDLLDLGCGTGRYVMRALAAGARVTGLDASPGMLDVARRKLGDAAKLLQHDLEQPLPFAGASFDVVVSALVLEHIASPAHLFAEAARVLRKGGRLVASTMHPALFLRATQAHYNDREAGVTYRFQSFDHQTADFVTAGLEAGLVLEVMREARVDADFAAAHSRAAKYLGWPMLLALRFRRD